MIKTHPIRLLPGTDLKTEIDTYVKVHNIKAGWVASCAGSLTHYHIRFANQPDGSSGYGHFEVVSLTGTVSVADSHLHISLSDSTGKTTGGHLLNGNRVYTTVEIILQ